MDWHAEGVRGFEAWLLMVAVVFLLLCVGIGLLQVRDNGPQRSMAESHQHAGQRDSVPPKAHATLTPVR